MKILFITDNFPPEINAPANRTYEHCVEWAKHGSEVTVITCQPNFPHGKVFLGYKNKWKTKEVMDGIKVIRVWSYITPNEKFFRRTLDFLSFCFTSFLAGLFIKTDVIIATSPQFFSALSGRWLSFFKRKPWVFEVRDLWPESIIAVGAMKRNIIIRFLEWIEFKLYKSAWRIVVVTDAFKEKIASRKIASNKILVFKNGVNLDFFRSEQKHDGLLNKLKLEGKFVVGYIGTHGMAHGLSFIIKCLEAIQITNPDIFFIFLGDGAEKENLQELSRKLKLQNLIFLDSVEKEEVVKYWNILDVALVNLKNSPTFLTVIPSKIFEAAAMQKPILLGLEGESKELIENYDAGICFQPENSSSFKSALRKMSENKEHYQKWQNGCRDLSKDFDRKKIALNMYEALKKDLDQS